MPQKDDNFVSQDESVENSPEEKSSKKDGVLDNKLEERGKKAASKNERDSLKENFKEEASSSPVEPVNPFEATPEQVDANVEPEPQVQTDKPREREVEEYNALDAEKLEREDEQKVVKAEEAAEPAPEPVNPFEAAPSEEPTLEKKALDDKPLDRKDEQFKEDSTSVIEESKTPEEIGQAEEAAVQSLEQGDTSSDETEFHEKDGSEADVPEVIDVSSSDSEGKAAPVEAIKTNGSKKADVDEFKSEFWDILQGAGITKKRLVYIAIGIVVAVFVIIGLFAGWFDFFGGDDSPKAKESETVEEDSSEPTHKNVDVSEAYGIISSYIFGLEFETPKIPLEITTISEGGDSSGLEAAFVFGGTDKTFQEKFVYYMNVLKRMDNTYRTDVYELVDLVLDRRLALNDHIAELTLLIEEAEVAQAEISQVMVAFDTEFEGVALTRDLSEEEFFTYLDTLYAQKAFDSLEVFIVQVKKSSEIKAMYNAYNILAQKYVLYIEALYPLLSDITSNVEAIIKGVRVFDIPDSDIEAIIRLEE